MTATSETALATPPPAAARLVGVVLVIDMVALGVVMPVLPRLIQDLVGGDAGTAARYIGWFAAVWALISLFALPILSALSDRFGRRPVLLASIFGVTIDYLAMALSPSLGWLLIGRVASGITAATFATSSAFIADVTPPADRAARYGLISIAVGLGYIIGPPLGGVLGDIDLRLPFFAAAALTCANWLYVAFVIPESLPAERRAPFSFRRANPVAAVTLYARRPDMLALAGVIFLYYLAQQSVQTTLVPYVAYRFDWSAKTVGTALALLGLGTILVQGLVLRPFVGRFGERAALATGLLAGAIGFGVYGAATATGPFLSAIAAFAFTGLVAPGFQGLLTRMVSPSEQGRLQGTNMGLMAIASLLGPLLFTEVFARSITEWRDWSPAGAPFYLACAMLLAALALARVRPRGP
jgi:DHA1 family tetracycline resistance protein-like MFS transporter